MLRNDHPTHNTTTPDTTERELTERQRAVDQLVRAYVEVAHEMPSAGWLSRRLKISRERARQHLQAIRAKREPGGVRRRR
jgi:hypothetical protein